MIKLKKSTFIGKRHVLILTGRGTSYTICPLKINKKMNFSLTNRNSKRTPCCFLYDEHYCNHPVALFFCFLPRIQFFVLLFLCLSHLLFSLSLSFRNALLFIPTTYLYSRSCCRIPCQCWTHSATAHVDGYNHLWCNF